MPVAAPRHLTPAARRLWRSCIAGYDLEPHHLELLRLACEAMDRASQARDAIAQDGAYLPGRFGMKAHPALAIERDSRLAFARLVRELGLDYDPSDASGPRAPRIGGRA